MTGPQQSSLVVDSHHHFWDLNRFDYYWMPPPPNVLLQNYLPENLKPQLEQAGVDRTVLVQAHKSVEEADFLLDIAEETDFVAGVVAWVDLTDPNVGAVLDKLMKRKRLVAIRHQVEDDPDVAWLSRDASIRGLKELAARDIRYDLLVKPPHLKYVPPLAEKVPGLKMVVDHIAKPLIADKVMEPWATEIAEIAAIPGIYCKISGMVTEADHASWTVDDLKPYVSHIVESFGFDRLMFGSDWPVCLLAASYQDVFNAALEAIGDISEGDKAKFLGQNAIEFYGLHSLV